MEGLWGLAVYGLYGVVPVRSTVSFWILPQGLFWLITGLIDDQGRLSRSPLKRYTGNFARITSWYESLLEISSRTNDHNVRYWKKKSPKQEAQNDIVCQPDTMCIASNKELATTSNGPKIKRQKRGTLCCACNTGTNPCHQTCNSWGIVIDHKQSRERCKGK